MKIQLFVILLLLAGCTSGSTTMLSGTMPAVGIPPENVELIIDEPQRSYKKLALVTASADTDDHLGFAKTEAAALRRLREQAGKAGADGVMNIRREVHQGDSIVSSNAWGTGVSSGNITTGSASGISTISSSQTIVFHGEAVTYSE
jgi:hypothetical protein